MGIPIIGDIIGAVKDLASEVIVDKDKRDEINIRLKELEDRTSERLHEELMAQVEVNKVEAAHPNVFVAGWRPFIGWVGGVGLGWAFVLAPMFRVSPMVDSNQLMVLVTAMLGVGAQRSFEKVKGVATGDLTTGNKK